MKDAAFGLTMMGMGMGVTLVTLYLMVLLIKLLIKLFPYQEEKTSSGPNKEVK